MVYIPQLLLGSSPIPWSTSSQTIEGGTPDRPYSIAPSPIMKGRVIVIPKNNLMLIRYSDELEYLLEQNRKKFEYFGVNLIVFFRSGRSCKHPGIYYFHYKRKDQGGKGINGFDGWIRYIKNWDYLSRIWFHWLDCFWRRTILHSFRFKTTLRSSNKLLNLR